MRAAAAALVAAMALVPAGTAGPAQAAKRPTRPVVMVVFDELPLTSLLDGRGRIDRVRYPNFAALAGDATWYANATTVADSTKLAIPSILDGRCPRSACPPTHRGHPRNLFTLLRGSGYRLKVQEEATSLCPYRGCRRRHGAHYFLSRDRLGRFKRWIAGIDRSRRPTLYYKHALLPHVPWVFTPQLRRYDRSVLGPIKGLNSSERSVFDRTLVRQSWQRHLLQVGAVDALLGQIIARMKATGRVRPRLAGGHGRPRRVVPRGRHRPAHDPARSTPSTSRRSRCSSRPRASAAARIDRSMMRTYDVLPTVAAADRAAPAARALRALGHQQPRAPARAGQGHFPRAAGPDHLQPRPPGAGPPRRGAAQAGAVRLGHAQPVSASAPTPSCWDGRWPACACRRRGAVRATLNGARDYKRIYRRSSFIPAHVTGRITGRPARRAARHRGGRQRAHLGRHPQRRACAAAARSTTRRC